LYFYHALLTMYQEGVAKKKNPPFVPTTLYASIHAAFTMKI
jgi:hypothetical protein